MIKGDRHLNPGNKIMISIWNCYRKKKDLGSLCKAHASAIQSVKLAHLLVDCKVQSLSIYFFWLWFFQAGSHYEAQAGLELAM
jgi:hypothetical protein